MKQILLPLVFMLMPVAASAQQSAHPQVSAPVEQSLRFGYFSYEEVLHTMPGYAIAKHNMDDLRAMLKPSVLRMSLMPSTRSSSTDREVLRLLSWKRDRPSFVN